MARFAAPIRRSGKGEARPGMRSQHIVSKENHLWPRAVLFASAIRLRNRARAYRLDDDEKRTLGCGPVLDHGCNSVDCLLRAVEAPHVFADCGDLPDVLLSLRYWLSAARRETISSRERQSRSGLGGSTLWRNSGACVDHVFCAHAAPYARAGRSHLSYRVPLSIFDLPHAGQRAKDLRKHG